MILAPLLRIRRSPTTLEQTLEWQFVGRTFFWPSVALSALSACAETILGAAFGNATSLNPNHTDARRFWGEECAQADDFACAVLQLKEAARLYR